MTELHPEERIDRAKQKRFLKLCTDKQSRLAFNWWRVVIVAYSQYIEKPLPRIKGDRDTIVAFREHVKDLANIYAPKRKQSCGHVVRGYCTKCPDDAAKQFEQMKRRRYAQKTNPNLSN